MEETRSCVRFLRKTGPYAQQLRVGIWTREKDVYLLVVQSTASCWYFDGTAHCSCKCYTAEKKTLPTNLSTGPSKVSCSRAARGAGLGGVLCFEDDAKLEALTFESKLKNKSTRHFATFVMYFIAVINPLASAPIGTFALLVIPRRHLLGQGAFLAGEV